MSPIKLHRIELRQVAMEPVATLEAAHGSIGERNVILVRVWSREGAFGWGECVAFPEAGYIGETVDSAWDALCNGIIPAVHNRPFESLGDLARYLGQGAPHTPVAAAALEMAAWDLESRSRGVSLATLLGGTRTSIAAGKTIGFKASSEALMIEVAAARSRGFQRIKIKIEPARALSASLAAVSAAGEVPVVADANASFAPKDLPLLRELDDLGLAWIEQPYDPTSLVATSKLMASIRTPVALDESARTVQAVERIVEAGAAHALSIKPGRLGGHDAAARAYRAASAAGLSMWIGGMFETGIGRAHNLALASLSGFDLPGDMGPSDAYWKRDLLATPIAMTSGHIAVPNGAGIGVEVDLDYVTAATARRHVLST